MAKIERPEIEIEELTGEGSGILTKYPVKAGDVVFCDDGEGHGLLNSGKGDLTFIALILKK